MPRGDKSSYTGKQKRQAEHIEESYENRGVPEREAEQRAWATVTRKPAGGKRAEADAANQKSMRHRGKAEGSVVWQRHPDLPQRGQRLQRRRRPRESAKLPIVDKAACD